MATSSDAGWAKPKHWRVECEEINIWSWVTEAVNMWGNWAPGSFGICD